MSCNNKKEVINMSRFYDISDDKFIEIFNESLCIRDIVEKLGFSRNSGSMAIKVKERIKKLGLDINELEGRNAYTSGQIRYSLDEILIENSFYENIKCLKKRLVKEGRLEYKCAECENTGSWNGKPLVLELEHKNGKNRDHRIENLCFLCPNCHSQTKTYCGGNIGNYSEDYDSNVDNIKDDILNSNLSLVDIANKYNVCLTKVRGINSGIYWADSSLSYPLRPYRYKN